MPRRRTAFFAVTLAAMACHAFAQDAPDASAPSDADALRGPSVQIDDAPVTPELFGEMKQRTGAMSERVPHGEFMRALRSLRTHEDAALHPTKEQLTKIMALHRAYAQELRTFRDANPEAGEMMRAVQPSAKDRAPKNNAKKKDTKNAPDDKVAGAPASGDSDRARRMELLSKAPSPAATQRAMWDVLTPEQQKRVQASLAASRAQREAQRDERLMGQYREQAKDRFDKADARGAQQLERAIDRLPKTVRAQVEALPMERRVELFNMLRDMPQDERRRLMRDVRNGKKDIEDALAGAR